MLTHEQMQRLTERAVALHRSGLNPLQLIRQKWAAMTPEQKAAQEAKASAWAIDQD